MLGCLTPAHYNKETQADIQKRAELFFLPSINMYTRHEKYSKGHKRAKPRTKEHHKSLNTVRCR